MCGTGPSQTPLTQFVPGPVDLLTEVSPTDLAVLGLSAG
jgi:hypothetical protein